RKVGDLEYIVQVRAFVKGSPSDEEPPGVELKQAGPHEFMIQPAPTGATRLEFVTAFTYVEPGRGTVTLANVVGSADQAFAETSDHWNYYWRSTAAVDFSGSTNPLAEKFEKRIVLSR